MIQCIYLNMTPVDNTEILRKVFPKVQSCLESLVSGSGHLVSYSLLPHTFSISKAEKFGENCTKYFFSTQAYRESEFTVYDDTHKPEPEDLSGSIVLDEHFNIMRDDNGKVLLEPWTCNKPIEHQPLLNVQDRARKTMQVNFNLARGLIHQIIEQSMLEPEDRLSKFLEALEKRIQETMHNPEQCGEASVLEEIHNNVIVGIMTQDLIAMDDPIDSLLHALQNRIDHFDDYFMKLKNSALKGPYKPPQ